MKANLEQTVAYLTKVVESGIKPEKWLTLAQLGPYVTESNVGKYYIVDNSGEEHLYYITHRDNDGLIALDLGKWPAVGPQGITGEKGDSPVVTISNSNTWVIDGVDTGKPARGEQGEQGVPGLVGKTGIGVAAVTSASNADYSVTKAEGATYDTYDTTMKMSFYDGADLTDDEVSLTLKLPHMSGGGGGGGTTLYRHIINIYSTGGDDACFFTNFIWINTRATAYTEMWDIFNDPDICGKLIPAYVLDEWGDGSLIPVTGGDTSRIGMMIRFLDTSTIECQCYTERTESVSNRSFNVWEPYVSESARWEIVTVDDTVTALN